jgi:hypothetical protein
VYVSNSARAVRVDLDGLEYKTFDDDEGFPHDDPTLTDLERRVIALMLDCARVLSGCRRTSRNRHDAIALIVWLSSHRPIRGVPRGIVRAY